MNRGGRRSVVSRWAGLSAILACGAWAGLCFAQTAAPPESENMALGKPYTLQPAGNYSFCTDPDDKVQLTDGQSTAKYFWTQKGTVGWTHAAFAAITVDLKRVEPIGGVALTTAAGAASVQWPAEIHVLVSDDGKTYRDQGDLVALDQARHGRPPRGLADGRRRVPPAGAATGQDSPGVACHALARGVRIPGDPAHRRDACPAVRLAGRAVEPAGPAAAGGLDAGDLGAPGAVHRAAEELLAHGAEEVLAAEGVDQIRWHQPKERTRADAVRVKLLDALAALERKPG